MRILPVDIVSKMRGIGQPRCEAAVVAPSDPQPDDSGSSSALARFVTKVGVAAARLEHCRKLITAEAGVTSDATSQVLSVGPELLVIADEESEDEDEGNIPSRCTCRFCHAELQVAGRLKGTPTLELLSLARLILALLPTLMQWVSAELMEHLRSRTIDSRRLPGPLRKLLNHQRWLPL